ncbi:hypothetical protein IFM89_002915 [Coptis chinensis]|uniref:NADP-dependent oxidoreductase domain-containing protein n=1 Tax=Coptis chinensis TaxID=261450 RepID=A0A835IH87_9MAGN|nr:hypothetical protein IFM89_002915 [Coptis chinensis]
MATIKLNNGLEMPIIGLGVWRMEGKSIKDLLFNAINIGYRHFDCAGVGTTSSALDEDGVLEIDTTISLESTWHAMEDLVSMGLVKQHWYQACLSCRVLNAILSSVFEYSNLLLFMCSNYDIFLTRDCLAYSKVKPAVNQIETHPYFQRDSLVKFCQKHEICVTAHTPLGGAAANIEWFGSVSCLDDPVLKGVAEKYKKTVAQIVLRWGIQRSTVVIPKSSLLRRLQENFDVFGFELTKGDMELIKGVDRKLRTNQPAKFWGMDLYA